MNDELLQEAIDAFGEDIVEEVISLVELSDPDGVYSMFLDMGMEEHYEIIEMLYFEQ
jgi:hypothetical protein